jgi:hypothetical protein
MSDVDYSHVRRLYAWAVHPKGGGLFLVPDNTFLVLCLASFLAYYFFHFWLLLIPAFMFYGAYEKRREFKRALL